MNAPPEMRTPILAGTGGAEVRYAATPQHYPNRPANAIAVEDAVRHVGRATAHLQAGQWRLDEGGYHCDVLDDLAADAAALLATWAGRRVPDYNSNVPPWMAQAAREWRRQNRRTY